MCYRVTLLERDDADGLENVKLLQLFIHSDKLIFLSLVCVAARRTAQTVYLHSIYLRYCTRQEKIKNIFEIAWLGWIKFLRFYKSELHHQTINLIPTSQTQPERGCSGCVPISFASLRSNSSNAAQRSSSSLHAYLAFDWNDMTKKGFALLAAAGNPAFISRPHGVDLLQTDGKGPCATSGNKSDK